MAGLEFHEGKISEMLFLKNAKAPVFAWKEVQDE